jgi:O-antigen ligase
MWLWRLIKERERPKLGAPMLLLGAFIASAAVSAVMVNYSQVWRSTAIAGALSLLVLAVFDSLKERNQRIVTNVLYVVTAACCLFGLYQFAGDLLGLPTSLTGLRPQYTKAVFGFPRIHSTALEPLYFANFLLIPLIILIYKTLTNNINKLELLLLPLVGITFFLTMSRGAFIALIVGLFWLLMAGRRRIGRRGILNSTAMILGMLLAGSLGLFLAGWLSTGDPSSAPRRFYRMVSVDLTRTVSFSEREAMRARGIEIWKENPLLGVGLSGIGPYLHNYPSPYTLDHQVILNNQAIELLAETGIIGAALYYAFFVFCMVQAWRDRHAAFLVVPLSAAFLAIHIQAQSYSGFFLTYVWFLAGWLLSSTKANGRAAEATRPSPS